MGTPRRYRGQARTREAQGLGPARLEAARGGRPLGTLVERLAAAEIGGTFNQYADSTLRRSRLAAYLERRADAPILLVGEAAGYRGARISGLPFTSERQLTGEGPAEATATIVHRVLAELGLENDVLLWNVVPTHPGTQTSNRRPTRAEIEAGSPPLARRRGPVPGGAHPVPRAGRVTSPA